MNIIQHTSTQLTVENSNRQWLWGVLFSIPFVALGLGLTAFTSNVTTLRCQRTKSAQLSCQRIVTGLLGTEITLIPGQVMKAGVVTANGVGVVLSTSKGQMELAKHRLMVREEQRDIANRINAFIRNSQQQNFKIQQDDRWAGLITGANFFIPGMAIIGVALAIPMYVLCNFDQSSGQLTVEKRYRLFNTKVMNQYKLIDAQHAEVKRLPISNRSPIYLVRLMLISTKSIALSPPTRDRQECETLANTINTFLKLKEV
ncbi:hypothetical protein JOY44_02950 [Phormidium sp. CLA17]|uniref:hypothetical protein n=1 Tax=Leptolyngbya sp. Cla-17 TaxID=2803751 RepID=UPI001490C12C|nr:hypothetical protein [Leptolyngbya sp. Cla-17]MBM0740583.1 hypothetical protein [Leptolyngbya sp. Cla-17]